MTAEDPQSVTGVPRSVSLARLEQLDIPVDTAGLTTALRTGSTAVRVEAAFLLGSELDAGGSAVAAELESALSDDNARVRVEAAFWLAESGQRPDARELLTSELQGDPFAGAPIRAAVALARLGDPAGYPVVVRQLESSLPSNRLEAVFALASLAAFQGETVDGQVVDVQQRLDQAARDPEPLVRNEAIRVRDLLPGG